MNPNNTISVIMPALNEEKNITAAIDAAFEALRDFGLSGEIIVVNDGSSDKTPVLAQERASRYGEGLIKLINHDKPKGIGASFFDGLDNATGDIVVMIPGDNENDPKETMRYVGLLDHVDIVVPFVFNRQTRSIFRNALSFCYRFIINTTFRVNFNYTNGTILYRRSILSNMDFKSAGFFFQTEILIKAVKRGYLFAEVPYRLGLRKSGASKAVSFPSFMKVAGGYIRLVKDCYLERDRAVNTFSVNSASEVRYKKEPHG
jgi:glycosyltransferase involved in cell wall biosynthesis